MRLDNDASPSFQALLKEKCIDYQLAPPGMHRRNTVELASRTFKDHFIAGLCTMDPDLPMQIWDRLLEQAEITLKLLCPLRLNPRLSAYAQLNGGFYFNRIPMAPPVTRTIVHEKPHNRGTWSPNRHEGCYVRPAMLHYRCITSYIPKTEKERVSENTDFLPATLTLKRISSKDAITHAAADLTHALLNPTPTSLLTTLGDNKIAALMQLAEIFTKPAPPQVTPPLRVHTPETTADAAPETPLRVDPHGDIAFQPGHTPRRPPQRVPHLIPDETGPMAPTAHQKSAETPKVTKQHRYNTRAMRLQGQDLMANHVATINTPPYTPRKPAPLMRPAGEDWEFTDQVTGKLTLQPGRANAVICPETGKAK